MLCEDESTACSSRPFPHDIEPHETFSTEEDSVHLGSAIGDDAVEFTTAVLRGLMFWPDIVRFDVLNVEFPNNVTMISSQSLSSDFTSNISSAGMNFTSQISTSSKE